MFIDISRILFITTLILCGCVIADAEVLEPPPKVLDAKDVIIERYSSGKQLELFDYIGHWEAKQINGSLSIIGKSMDAPIYLISNNKLSKKPKSFKLDFIVEDINKEYGFIFGNQGILIRDNNIYSATFNGTTRSLEIIKGSRSKPLPSIKDNNFYTLDINTGYDPIGRGTLGCTIYINGVGISPNCPNEDSVFGVYLGEQNSITIMNIRWGIGSH